MKCPAINVWGIVLSLCFFHPYAPADGYAGNPSIQIRIDVYPTPNEEYILLQPMKADTLYLFPLMDDVKTWLKDEEWNKHWRVVEERFIKDCGLDTAAYAASLQDSIESPTIDSVLMEKDWNRLYKKLKESIRNQTPLEGTHHSFQFQQIEEHHTVHVPQLNDPAFFDGLHALEERLSTERLFARIKEMKEIVILEDDTTSIKIDILESLADTNKYKISFDFEKTTLFIENVDIEGHRIKIVRKPKSYQEPVERFKMIISHKTYPDLQCEKSITVHHPEKPILVRVQRMLEKFLGLVSRNFHGFSIAGVIVGIILGWLFHFIYDKVTYEHIDEGKKRSDVSRMKDDETNWRQEYNKLLIKHRTVEKKHDSLEIQLQKCKDISNSIKRSLNTIGGYPESDRMPMGGLPSHRLMDGLLKDLNEIRTRVGKIDDGKTAEINAIKKNYEKEKQKFLQQSESQKSRFHDLLNTVRHIFTPMEKKYKEFQFLFSNEYWQSEYDTKRGGFAAGLAQQIEAMEITVPTLFKETEKKIERAEWITKKYLQNEYMAIPGYDLEADISSLHAILKHPYFGEKGNRPSWVYSQSLSPDKDGKKDVETTLHEKVWNTELGESIQIVQKILFKLDLILSNKSRVEDTVFKKAAKLKVASSAVHYLLQNISISMRRIYHDVRPGEKMNLDFVTKEGDKNILKTEALRALIDPDVYQRDDIVDVAYWGYTEIDGDMDFSNGKKSRIVTATRL